MDPDQITTDQIGTTGTTNNSVAPAPADQTNAPANTNSATSTGSAGTGTMPMTFDDGTSANVPLTEVSGAVKDGGKIGQFMKFDDGTSALVPLEKVHDAIKDGGMIIGASPIAPHIEMHESPVSTKSFTIPHAGSLQTENSTPKENAHLITAGLTGLAASGAVAGGIEAAPAVYSYMSNLNNIMKIAKTFGWAGFGLKEAHDLYKIVSGMSGAEK